MTANTPEDEDRIVEEIYDALDEGAPERALASARIALHGMPDDPVLHFLAGVALSDLDHPAEAVLEFGHAIDADPDDPEFRAARAQALFATCQFAEAKDDAEKALTVDASHADALWMLGLVLEREARFDASDDAFLAAARIDPERFQAPIRLSHDAMAGVVTRAGAMLPEEFRRCLDEVPVVVEDLPSDEILTEEEPPLDPEVLGLFVGTARTERSYASAGVEAPPRILLFQRNLERFARDEAELKREIARTLHHELAHYLGFAEEDMVDLDLD